MRPVVTLRFDVDGGSATVAQGPGSTLRNPALDGLAAVTLTVAAAASGSAASTGVEIDSQQLPRTEPLLSNTEDLALDRVACRPIARERRESNRDRRARSSR